VLALRGGLDCALKDSIDRIFVPPERADVAIFVAVGLALARRQDESLASGWALCFSRPGPGGKGDAKNFLVKFK